MGVTVLDFAVALREFTAQSLSNLISERDWDEFQNGVTSKVHAHWNGANGNIFHHYSEPG